MSRFIGNYNSKEGVIGMSEKQHDIIKLKEELKKKDSSIGRSTQGGGNYKGKFEPKNKK